MNSLSDSAIFYDHSQRRLRYYRWTTGLLIVGLLFSFGFTITSVLHSPSLPELSLPNNSPARSVANIPSKQPSSKLSTLSAALEQRITLQQKTSDPTKPAQSLGFFVNWDDNSFSSLKANINAIDTLVPEWSHLISADGTIIPDDQKHQDEVLQFIRSTRPSLPITPLINNYSPDKQDWDEKAISGMLANPAARQKTIAALLDLVKQNNFAGVSIDFENIPSGSIPNLVLFMSELSAAFRPENLSISQNIPLDDDSFDPATLGKYADYLILMAYDEHAIGSDTAGPVASQAWYEHSLLTRLGQLPAEKYIIALGNYGYDWPGTGENGDEVSFQDSMRLARDAQAKILLDPAMLNPTFSYVDADGTQHSVWYLDAITTFNEVSFADTYHPYGYALWRMGAEDPRVWSILHHGQTSLNESTLESLKTMPYGYDLDYEGSGEILQVTGTPQIGKSDFSFDAARNLITEEHILSYPSGYVITRYGGKNPKKIALTFDDGPDPNYTPRILDILNRFHVPATFFIVGLNASQHPDILRHIESSGSEIGSHTFTHPNINLITSTQFGIELDALQRLIESAIGRHTLLFRPPYAEDIEPATPEQIAPLLTTSERGYYTVAMHIDPSDWNQPGTSADMITQNIIDSAKNGDGNIILLHDGGGDREQTVAALPQIITQLQNAGFELVSVSNLLGTGHDTIMPPLPASERTTSLINNVSFLLVDHFGSFMRSFFVIGIVFGLGRLAFIIILALIQKLRNRSLASTRFDSQYTPTVAVIIPAYNEERVILTTIKSILRSEYPTFEILVVDDGSTDATWPLLQKHFAHHPSVHIFTKHNSGKSSALNYGIRQTTADIIITLDADTLFHPDTITKLVRHFADQRIGAVAGNAKVGNRRNILTKWQALEYIVSQNLDRRAFELMNAITVVPGSVGAWRREAILLSGGFSSRTLAEDADMTFSVVRRDYRVAYDEDAFGFTEAPETVGAFVRQRFRWMYGTIQTLWKHRVLFLNIRRGKGLGLIAMPNILIFQIIFPLLSPFIDLALIFSLLWSALQRIQHPIDYSGSFQHLLNYYLLFTAVDIGIAIIAFLLEKRREDWHLILWLPLQRFFYRQLMYYVAFKTITTVIKGRFVRWGRQERLATVSLAERF